MTKYSSIGSKVSVFQNLSLRIHFVSGACKLHQLTMWAGRIEHEPGSPTLDMVYTGLKSVVYGSLLLHNENGCNN